MAKSRAVRRLVVQASIWLAVPALVALAVSTCKPTPPVAYAPHAPAAKGHDPRTCPNCMDRRGDWPVPPCGGAHDPRTCTLCAEAHRKRVGLRDAAELDERATSEFPDGHPLKGHEHLFIGR